MIKRMSGPIAVAIIWVLGLISVCTTDHTVYGQDTMEQDEDAIFELEHAIADPISPWPHLPNMSPCFPCAFPDYGYASAESYEACMAIVGSAYDVCMSCEEAHGSLCEEWCEQQESIKSAKCWGNHHATWDRETCQYHAKVEYDYCMVSSGRSHTRADMYNYQKHCSSRYLGQLVECNEFEPSTAVFADCVDPNNPDASPCDFEEVSWCCLIDYAACDERVRYEYHDCLFCCGTCDAVSSGGDDNVLQCGNNCWTERVLNIQSDCCGLPMSPTEECAQ